jgi:hypothetical protein
VLRLACHFVLVGQLGVVCYWVVRCFVGFRFRFALFDRLKMCRLLVVVWEVAEVGAHIDIPKHQRVGGTIQEYERI